MKKHGKNSISTYLDTVMLNPDYEEKWIFIGGEKSIYKIRSNGVIISTEYQGHKRKKPHIMCGGVDKDGYRLVTLTHKKVKKTYRVHILVAEYFIPNPFNKPEVNHKDGNKLNNDVYNLEWVYPYENTHHAMERGLRWSSNNIEYIELVCSLLESNEYSMKEISKITGVSEGLVSKIHNGYCYKSISDKYNVSNYDSSKHASHDNTKMTDAKVIEICEEIVRNELTLSQLAKKFDVSTVTIKRILNGETRPDISCNYNFNGYSRVGINQFINNIERIDYK